MLTEIFRQGWPVYFSKKFKKLSDSPINLLEKYQVITGPKIREIPIVGGEGKTYKIFNEKKNSFAPAGCPFGGIIKADDHPGAVSPHADYEGRQYKWCEGAPYFELLRAMKAWYFPVIASLALSVGCGGGFNGNLRTGDSYRTLSRSENDVSSGDSVNFEVPVQVNKQVKAYLNYFSTERKEVIRRQLARSTQYLPMIKKIFREYGLPDDLAYLAMIESGFNPNARSHAGACGLWQFIKGTGRRYGLVINNQVDERFDPEKSTRAAARYLLDLYKQFGSWYLAAASYNCGEGRVQKELSKGNHNFWELSANKCLPTETKNYVPQMIAAIIIAKNPEKYGFAKPGGKQPLDQDNLEVAEPPVNLAGTARPVAAPKPQPVKAGQALAGSKPLAGKPPEMPPSAKTSGPSTPRPPAKTSVQADKKQSPKAAAEADDGSIPYKASLTGAPRAAPSKKGKNGKNGRMEQASAGVKKEKDARVKAGKGRKNGSPAVASKSDDKGGKARPKKKKAANSPGKKGKVAKPKPKSKPLMVSEAR